MAMSAEERRRRKAAYSREWHHRNKDKAREASARYRRLNPEKVKLDRRRLKLAGYGLTWEQYDELLAAQGNACAVCGATEPGAKAAYFDVDHDHDCCPTDTSCGRCVRGLLCRACNQALGMMRDSASRLRAAADYLERHKAGEA